MRDEQVGIDVGENKPINRPAYKMSPEELKELKIDNRGAKHKHRIHGNRLKLAKVQDQNDKTWKYPKSVMRGRINS
ncbi:hypothetical protein BB561_005320 [Smittium simulii]|uniref:Uncharacterized protein n=1 Tax=Smittium simulii TaxID=133385 RepID=A0A2T9YAX6_9FUNG|nr:hypothetical protein BB561_005320 [Smittium simulii]